MDDETFITHLLNSLPQAEYEGVILVNKERLSGGTCDLAQVEQLLEDKYQSMKFVKGWEEEEDDYALFASHTKKKGKKQFKGGCGYCGEIGHKAANCPDKKKKRTLKTNPTNKRHRNLKRMVKEKVRQICQKLNALIAEKWVILPGTARNLAKTPILLKKVSKIESSEN